MNSNRKIDYYSENSEHFLFFHFEEDKPRPEAERIQMESRPTHYVIPDKKIPVSIPIIGSPGLELNSYDGSFDPDCFKQSVNK